MPVPLPSRRSQVCVQRIINRLRNHSKRVIITSVLTTSRRAQAILPVTIENLPELRGHFPRNPVVPAVTMLEAMFQLAAVLSDAQGVDASMDYIKEARFRRIITPSYRELRIKVVRDVHGYKGIVGAGPQDTLAEAVFSE